MRSFILSRTSALHPLFTLLLSLAIWGPLAPNACTGVSAQIVNIEDRRKSLDSLGWHGQVDLGANLTRNTNTVTTLKGALRLDRWGKKGNVLALADYQLIQVEGDNAVNAGFLHLRYGYEMKDPYRWESFAQVQYNERLRLTARYLTGTGIRRRLYKSRDGRNRAYFGLFYMYEYNELSESNIIYRDHRMSSYLTFNVPLSGAAALSNTTYYQPRLPNFEFPRISTVTTLEVGLTEKLRVTSKFSLTYDERVNRDLPEVPALTYNWTNGLRYAF